MQDDKAKIESELTEFFAGLDAGLKTFREVRSVYDEQVAFEFNATSFFWPDENKTSDILKFFLDPKENHGQKGTFLKLFVKQFNLQILPAKLLDNLELIKTEREDPTVEKRRIDITIRFGNDEYIIGIENKIGTAPDLDKQLHDYVKELRNRTNSDDNKWTLFYLTPEGVNPATNSIKEDFRDELVKNRNLRLISYREDIIGLLELFEMSCRAENVRAYLKDFRQYLKQIHIGETFMGENNFVMEHLRDHPEIVKHADALQSAVNSVKYEFFSAFWSKVAEQLKSRHSIDMARLNWTTSSYTEAKIEHSGSLFGDQSELERIVVINEPKHQFKFYTAIKLCKIRNELSSESKSRVEKMEKKLKITFKEVIWHPAWCAEVAIPHPEFNNGEAICEYLKDKDGSKMQDLATKTVETITKYIQVAESSWRETSIAEA